MSPRLSLFFIWIAAAIISSPEGVSQEIAPNARDAGPLVALQCIFALDANTAWVAGGYKDGISHSLEPALFRTLDGGQTWQELEVGIAPAMVASSIFFRDQETGWLAISNGSPGGGDPTVLRTNDGGATWSSHPIELPIPQAPSTAYNPVTIEFLTPQHGLLRLAHVIVEDEEAHFVSDDSGTSWRFSHARSASDSGERLSRARDGTLWRLGGYCETCDSNAVLWSNDDGISWQTVAPPVAHQN